MRFRPLRPSDFPLLQRWHGMPHVDAWWHERLDEQGIEAKYLPRIEGREPTFVYIMDSDSGPAGWIQWYRWKDYAEHASLLGAQPQDAGLDLAIGEPELLGRGLGSLAIRAFVEQIVYREPEIVACLSDPEARNTRSVRAFQKAGFYIVRTVQLPGESEMRHIVKHDRG